MPPKNGFTGSSSAPAAVLLSVAAASNERVVPAAALDETARQNVDLLAGGRRYVYSPVLQMQDNDDASRNAKRVWDEKRGFSVPKKSADGTKVLDCHVHLERNCKKQGDCSLKVWEDKFQPSINTIKRMPTLALVRWLVVLFKCLFSAVCPKTTSYYADHMEWMQATRAHAGPGCPCDNNGLEGKNKYQKDCQMWLRLGITRHACQLRDFVHQCSLDDFSHGLNFMEHFSKTVWNQATFVRISEGLASRTLELTFKIVAPRTEVVMFIMPRAKALEMVNLNKPVAEILNGLKPWKAIFTTLMGKSPENAMPGIKATYQKKAKVGFYEVVSFVDSFALLQPLQATAEFKEGLRAAMGIPAGWRIGPLMRCSCSDYMHFSVCDHVLIFHYNDIQTKDESDRVGERGEDNKQLEGRSFWEICSISGWLQSGTVGHVNNAQRVVGKIGRPRTVIKRGSALSKDL